TGEDFPPLLLAGRLTEKDVINDHPGARAGHRDDPCAPRRLKRSELWSDRHAAVRGEFDSRIRTPHVYRHRLDQRVDPGREPWFRQDRLQAADDPGLAGTGSA